MYEYIYILTLEWYLVSSLVMPERDRVKCGLIFGEFPKIFLNGIDTLIIIARSNKVAAVWAKQDFCQLKKDYGKEQSDVIMNITGNIIGGQVMGDAAKQLSERFGKIMPRRGNVSVNSSDTSISHSLQKDSAIPPSKIASLSSVKCVG